MSDWHVLIAVPYYPGGSLYARNPPVQPEVSLPSSLGTAMIAMHGITLLLFSLCAIDMIWQALHMMS